MRRSWPLMFSSVLLLGLALLAFNASAEDLTPDRLGVIYNRNDPASTRIAQYYVLRRNIPAANLIGLTISNRPAITRDELSRLRAALLADLPTNVQSLLLVWSMPYAVECMSITTAVAAGYRPGFCEVSCGHTELNPLFDLPGWLPADTAGWLPAMLLPTQDEVLAKDLIERGIKADGSKPAGTVYLVRTQDVARNVRAAEYAYTKELVSGRVTVKELTTPIDRVPKDIIGYFTGTARVEELSKLVFRPGAAADHLTSSGGILDGSLQMSALEWLRQGATASYGSVSEPCNYLGKFPSPAVFLTYYLRGDSLLEAYWKSVQMPGQGLFIGEPLARPYGLRGK